MSEEYAPFRFAILAEMTTTVEYNKKEYENRLKPVYFNICDEIVNEYEEAKNKVTIAKRCNYQYNKNKRAVVVAEKMLTDMKSINASMINQFTSVERMRDVLMDKKIIQTNLEHLENIDNEVNESLTAYNNYLNECDLFLQSYNYFTIHSLNIAFKQSSFLKKDEYFNVLKTIWNKTIRCVETIVRERMNPESVCYFEKDMHFDKGIIGFYELGNMKDEYFKVIIGGKFQSKNHAELSRHYTELNELLFSMYVLVKRIPITVYFLNQIIHNYARACIANEFLNDVMVANMKYREQRLKNKPLLPTSFWERIKYFFVSKNSNGDYIIPFSDTLRYINYQFELAGIENRETKFIINQLESDGRNNYNYVGYIFDSKYEKPSPVPSVFLIDDDADTKKLL